MRKKKKVETVKGSFVERSPSPSKAFLERHGFKVPGKQKTYRHKNWKVTVPSKGSKLAREIDQGRRNVKGGKRKDSVLNL